MKIEQRYVVFHASNGSYPGQMNLTHCEIFASEADAKQFAEQMCTVHSDFYIARLTHYTAREVMPTTTTRLS